MKIIKKKEVLLSIIAMAFLVNCTEPKSLVYTKRPLQGKDALFKFQIESGNNYPGVALRSSSADQRAPDISPDKSKVAYHGQGSSGLESIFIANINTNEAPVELASSSRGHLEYPKWSLSNLNSRIAVRCEGYNEATQIKTGSDAICVIDAATGEIRQVTAPRTDHAVIQGHDFIGDQHIIFSRTTREGLKALYLYDFEAQTEKELLKSPGYDLTEPAATTDANGNIHVAFIREKISTGEKSISVTVLTASQTLTEAGGSPYSRPNLESTAIDESKLRFESLAFDTNHVDLYISAEAVSVDCPQGPSRNYELFKVIFTNGQTTWNRISSSCTDDFRPAIIPR